MDAGGSAHQKGLSAPVGQLPRVLLVVVLSAQRTDQHLVPFAPGVVFAVAIARGQLLDLIWRNRDFSG